MSICHIEFHQIFFLSLSSYCNFCSSLLAKVGTEYLDQASQYIYLKVLYIQSQLKPIPAIRILTVFFEYFKTKLVCILGSRFGETNSLAAMHLAKSVFLCNNLLILCVRSLNQRALGLDTSLQSRDWTCGLDESSESPTFVSVTVRKPSGVSTVKATLEKFVNLKTMYFGLLLKYISFLLCTLPHLKLS